MDYKTWDEESEEIIENKEVSSKNTSVLSGTYENMFKEEWREGMYKFEGYEIAVPHFYCLEYYEDGKKMIVEMDFREDYFFLGPQLITHWEEPYEDIIIEMEEKKRILLNIREFLLTKTIPSHIIWI